MKLSVIIPAYNESDNITTTIQELFSVIARISQIEYLQVVIVDDHSSDNTYQVVEAMNDPRIEVLRLSKQSGSHTAIRVGLIEACGDAALCMSADGQDDPHCLEKMLEKWQYGVNVVWALRNNRNNESWSYQKAALFYYQILSLAGGDRDSAVDQSLADFFLLDRVVIEAINRCPERNTHLFGLIGWLGFNQDSVKYERRVRRAGKPKWKFRGRFFVGTQWIITFSAIPLKLMSLTGFCCAILGFLYALFLIANALFGHPAYGWSSLMVTMLVLAGIQMMMFGILGEYVWRNLDESRKRPLFFIEQRTTRIKKKSEV